MGNTQQPKHNKTQEKTKKETKSNEPDPKLYEWSKDKDVPQNLDFDIWYPLIKNYTMKSTLIECTKEEVEAIIPRTYDRAFTKGMDFKDIIDNFGK
eukprot:155298_1